MKDEYIYIVLPSNSSMNYFSENTTSHFITQLPQQICLQGSWSVALTKVQIPLTFQHVSSELLDNQELFPTHAHTAVIQLISDHRNRYKGRVIPFDYGTLTVKLHYKRLN